MIPAVPIYTSDVLSGLILSLLLSAICLITRAKFAIGDWILPRNLEISASLEGIFAITWIPSAS